MKHNICLVLQQTRCKMDIDTILFYNKEGKEGEVLMDISYENGETRTYQFYRVK